VCRGVLLRRQLADFVIERGEGLLKHFPVGGRGRTAQIALRARTRQLQHTAALLRCPLFRREGSSAGRRPTRGFFLLGFHELGVESTCHVSIVRWSLGTDAGCWELTLFVRS